jgi:hypothetical protein
MAASSNKGINKQIDKGRRFTEFGFEQSLPIFRMIGTEPKKIESPNLFIRVTGITKYLVIWLFGKTKFGDLGCPKKTGETKFGNNRPKLLGALPKNGISLEGITIFLEKILAKTPNPNFCKVSLHLGHSHKELESGIFSIFLGEMSILGSQEVITKIGSIAKIGLPIRPNWV